MPQKEILWYGRKATLACDGRCSKAWGISQRPEVQLGEDEDDIAYLADAELGQAPEFPGTWEGGEGKPRNDDHDDPSTFNKWCARECERSKIAEIGEKLKLPDFSQRLINQPWKHSCEECN